MTEPVSVHCRAVTENDAEPLGRFLVANDVPEVRRRFHPFPLTLESARRIAGAKGRDRFYVAELGGRIVGLSMLRGWDEGFEIPSFGILIDRNRHGAGLGSRLTDFTLDQARRLGSTQIRLSVYASNRRACEMYRRRGFRELERHPVSIDGGADQKIVMIAALEPAAE